MEIRYHGRHGTGVDIAVADGVTRHCAAGGTVDVPDAVAAALVAEQPDAFSVDDKPAKSTEPAKKTGAKPTESKAAKADPSKEDD